MKKTALALFLFLVSLTFIGLSVREIPDVVVETPIYKIKYSQKFEQPLEIEYRVLCNQFSENRFSRKGLNFYLNDTIHTSDNLDYYKNVWDKGHMAPAASFNCDSINLRTTFSYVNCALQHRGLNRKHWKLLEQYERELAINNDITIKILVDFSNSNRLSTGAMIPTGFTKIIYKNGKPFKEYYFENKENTGYLENFLVKKW